MGRFRLWVISRIVTTKLGRCGFEKMPNNIESDVTQNFSPFEAAQNASLRRFSLWGLSLAKNFDLKFANKSLITARYWVYLFRDAVKMSAATLGFIVLL